ncbi:MAG TPA: response regulator, partial [Isosphaeraceae bacterium]|nr:response regulator [Isosphaeraceae bacterium]
MLDHPYRILIADDEEASRDLIARLLREEFGSLDLLIEIAAVATVAEAKKSLRAFSEADRPFDVLILDWKFAGHKGNGDDLLRWLKAESLHVNTEVILLTGHLDENPRLPEIVLEHGAYAFAEKA